ncbi:MAG TPA: cell envelope integrity protein TolA, partial [Thermoleophilia bacterium]|nr:cell envelope integrity protein TolA [Thermoleophilia bacterium]
ELVEARAAAKAAAVKAAADAKTVAVAESAAANASRVSKNLPNSFIDSFGAPKSGGRTHKGRDYRSSEGR